MRIEITERVGVRQLAQELSEALGISVALSVREPGQVDSDGNPIPGVVVFINPNTGDELDGLSIEVISSVLAAHVAPPLPTRGR